jgi:translation initiation factor 1
VSAKTPPAQGSAGTLGHLLRAKGVTVGTPAAPPSPAPTADDRALDVGGATKVVVRREKKGRGGKTATVVEGIKLPPSGLERIARDLKRALGCGAHVDASTIVVQGDMTARIEAWLTLRGVTKVVIGN